MLVVNGTLACITAIHNAQVRVLYALGRDQIVVPRRMAQTHAIYRSPHQAIQLQSILSLIIVTVVGFWLGSFAGFVFLGELMTLSTLIVHIMANISLTRYYRKIGQFRWLVHGLFPTMATLLYLLPIYFTLFPVPPFPDNIPPYLLIGWLIVGLILLWAIFQKHPDRIRNAGLITSDTDPEHDAG